MSASQWFESRRTRMLLAVILAIAALPFVFRDWKHLTVARPTVTTIADEDFDKGAVALRSAASVSGFIACTYGWCLPGGGEGTLTYRIELPATTRAVRLRAWLYRPPGLRNTVDVSFDDGRSFERVATDVQMEGATIDLRAPASTPIVWRFWAANRGTSTQLILDKIVLSSLDHVPRPEVSPLALVLAFAGLAVSVGLLLPRWKLAVATAAVLSVALYFRYAYLLQVVSNPLDPDAVGYLAYARSFRVFGPTGFYSAAFSEREPMFVFVAHLFLRFVVDSPFGLRLMGVAFSVLVVWAATAFGRRLFGTLGGLLAGFAIAVNQPLAREASRGLRLELEMLLWLAFLAAAFAWTRRKDGWKALALGGLGGVLVLTRSTYLPVVLPLQALALLEWPIGWRRTLQRCVPCVALAGLTTVAMFAPHRYAMYARHGDALWDTAQYARWNANMEFVGSPGFPSWAELRKNSYLGPPLRYSDYLFKLHTPRQLIGGTLRGYYKLYHGFSWTIDSNRASASWWFNLALQVVALIGFSIALLSWRWLWLPVAFVLCEFAPSFLYDRRLVEPFRHTYQGLPLMIFAVLVAGQRLRNGIARRRSRRPEPARRAPIGASRL